MQGDKDMAIPSGVKGVVLKTTIGLLTPALVLSVPFSPDFIAKATSLQTVVKAQSSPDKANENLNLFLITSATKGQIEEVRKALKSGADINYKENQLGSTALIKASQKGYPEIVKLLIERGAKLDIQRNDGGTALHMAAQNGHAEIIKLLIEGGANLNLRARQRFTACDDAVLAEDILFLVES